MTNVTINGGLVLHRLKLDQPLETVIALSGDSTVLGVGDPVKVSAGGATSTGGGRTVQAVTRANGTSDPIYGVVTAVLPNLGGTGAMDFATKIRLASTAQYLLIRPANNQDEYAIQDDAATQLSAANFGNNAQMTPGNASAATGLSTFTLAASSAASGNATFPLKIMGYVEDATNDLTSTGIRFVVTLNNVTRSGSTGTAGV